MANDDLATFRHDLIAYLRARFDEEDAIALTACGDPDCGVWAASENDVDFDQYKVGGIRPATAAHIARHDPARVLRDIAAKRRIVDYCDDWRRDEFETGPILELLVLSYMDREDFREEWKL